MAPTQMPCINDADAFAKFLKKEQVVRFWWLGKQFDFGRCNTEVFEMSSPHTIVDADLLYKTVVAVLKSGIPVYYL